jgi:hypothetical protein
VCSDEIETIIYNNMGVYASRMSDEKKRKDNDME